jgi:hypothetical protein
MGEPNNTTADAATFGAAESLNVSGQGPALSSTTHLVGHLLREIESALRSVAETPAVKKDESKDGHRQSILSVLSNLSIDQQEPAAQAWLSLANRESGLQAKAHRQALEPPRRADTGFLEFWDKMQMIFDFVLDKFEANYLNTNKTLDALLSKHTPTAEDARTLRQRTPNHFVSRRYFFDKLASPAWLPLLRAEEFFKSPPVPLVDAENETVRFLAWPESEFLVRMAEGNPELVTEIVLEIPETDNGWVHADILDIGTRVPLPQAAQVAEKERQWLEKQTHFWSNLPEKVSDLICHLCNLGAVQAALQLAKSLLEVLPDPQAEEKRKRTESWSPKPEARARFDLYEYGQVLEKCAPVLVQAADLDTISLLCDLLESAIRNSRRRLDDTEDYSSIWRPAIEDHGQNSLNKLEDYLDARRCGVCPLGSQKFRQAIAKRNQQYGFWFDA